LFPRSFIKAHYLDFVAYDNTDNSATAKELC
jgi:hypothetical protein